MKMGNIGNVTHKVAQIDGLGAEGLGDMEMYQSAGTRLEELPRERRHDRGMGNINRSKSLDERRIRRIGVLPPPKSRGQDVYRQGPLVPKGGQGLHHLLESSQVRR